jgi:DNA-directed RNA polymerase specialized sigma24 family protein
MNFDAAFLCRLKQRDPETCTFLVSSLTPALEARLRYKLRDQGAIEDIRNETFCRVFSLVPVVVNLGNERLAGLLEACRNPVTHP